MIHQRKTAALSVTFWIIRLVVCLVTDHLKQKEEMRILMNPIIMMNIKCITVLSNDRYSSNDKNLFPKFRRWKYMEMSFYGKKACTRKLIVLLIMKAALLRNPLLSLMFLPPLIKLLYTVSCKKFHHICHCIE